MLDWFRKFLQKLFAPQPEPPKWWLWARNNWVVILNLIAVVVAFVLVFDKKLVVVDVLLGATFISNILYLGYTWLNPQPEPPSPDFDPQPEPPGKELKSSGNSCKCECKLLKYFRDNNIEI